MIQLALILVKKLNLFKNFSTIGHLDHFHYLVKFV